MDLRFIVACMAGLACTVSASGPNGSPREDGRAPVAVDRRAAAAAADSYRRLPLTFEENLGQVDAQVRFMSRSAAGTIFMTRDEIVLVRSSSRGEQAAPLRIKLKDDIATRSLVGSNELAAKVNYLVGNDRAKWRTGLPLYSNEFAARVLMRLYSGYENRSVDSR